jgi:hypothetical protein
VCVARSSLKEGCNKPPFRGLGKAKLYKIPYVQAWLNEKSFKDIASASPEVLTLSLSLCVCVCFTLELTPFIIIIILRFSTNWKRIRGILMVPSWSTPQISTGAGMT